MTLALLLPVPWPAITGFVLAVVLGAGVGWAITGE